jgi:dTMP kinase
VATVAEEIAALRGTKPAGLKDLLVHPSFSRLWRAMLVSSLGDWVGFVAVATLVSAKGGKALGGLAVAGVMIARLLPSVLFGPVAGVLVDRLDRRRVMVSADIGRGALYATMPFLPKLWMIFALSFLIECLSLLWTPSKDASVPNLVPRGQLTNANSIGLITTYGTLPLGATVYTALAGMAAWFGGTYLDAHPWSLALWLDSLTFAFSAWMVWGLDLRKGSASRDAGSEPLSAKSALADIRDGIRFLREHALVRTLTVGIVIAFAGAGSVMSLGPPFAQYSLGAATAGFGILMTALGIGMGAGMALASVLAKRDDRDLWMGVSLEASACCLFLLAAMPAIGWAAFFTVPMGVGAGVAWVIGYTMLQENVDDEYRGRTFAVLNTMVRTALFISLALFPILATPYAATTITVFGYSMPAAGYRIALWIGGAVVLAAGAMTRRGLRRFRVARPRPLALVPTLKRADGAGLFIVFEGVEGAGKGTQIERAHAFVASRGHDVLVTREPGGTDFGEHLRDMILDPQTGKLDPRAEALVFAASRAQHVTTVIRPALAQGKVVICDRFVDSSIAYQGVARGLGEQDVLTLNAWATQGLFPDLVLLLSLDPDYGLLRSEGEADRIESEDGRFHAKVADAYEKIAEEHPDKYVVIDASGSEEEVAARVREALERVLVRVEEGRGGPT